jgi:iron complex transport system substrate-binding protein
VTGRTPADLSAIKALGPDVIVDFGTVNPSYAATADRTQAATSIPYVLLDGALQASSAAYRSLGRIVQAQARGETLAARSQAMLDEVKSKLSGVPASSRKRVYIARGPDGNDSYGAGYFSDEVVAPAGGVNVAEGWGAGNLNNITPQKVRDANPDLVIALDPHFSEVVAKTPAWKEVPAIAAGRLYLAPHQPFGWLDEPPSVNRLIGLRWLAGMLYPERFNGDLRAVVRDFYLTFYQADPSGPQLDRLIAAKH